jgi:quercetin dioxygenase-like cupin family protein
MSRALLLPLTTILALATGVGMLGVATTLSQDPIVLATATATVVPTVPPTATPPAAASPVTDSLVAHIPVQLPTGSVVLSVARLTLRPDEVLPPAEASDPIVLLVESGAVAVRLAHAALANQGLDETRFDTVLHRGQQVVVSAGMIHALRNAGQTPAVVLVMTVAAEATPCPDPVRCTGQA